MGWSRPPLSRPLAGRAGAPCSDRPASGPAGSRPVQPEALRARKEGEEDGRGPAKGWRREKEDEREEETAGKPAASDRGWGRGAAGEASEGANDVQRVESFAERTKRLAEKKTREAL